MKKPVEVQREYPLSDKSFAARYARLISAYKFGKNKEAAEKSLKMIDELLIESPGDSYLLELKGQMCFETGQISKAIGFYRESSQKRPSAMGVRLMLGHAISEQAKEGDLGLLKEGADALTKVIEMQPENPFAWRLLASIYGKMKEPGNAAACLAEEAWLQEKKEFAKVQATKGKAARDPVLAKRSSDILQHFESDSKK
jgi:predicted Zn-dependent protease